MLIVAWETTAACNLSCRYCRACATPAPEPDELSTAEALAFLDSIAPLQPMLILSGVSPCCGLISSRSSGMPYLWACAFPWPAMGPLITPQVADEIAASGVSRVSISLDGASAEKHDLSRGPGSFRAGLKGRGKSARQS